jgi:hypothetical protein
MLRAIVADLADQVLDRQAPVVAGQAATGESGAARS